MSNSSWHGGKGDKSRTSDVNKFSRNMEKIYEKKTWQFWAVWEGLNTEEMDFDDSGLEDFEQISYKDYITRLKR
jgi:hypothetical protein